MNVCMFQLLLYRHKHHININRCTLKKLYVTVVDNNAKMSSNTLKSAHLLCVKIKQIKAVFADQLSDIILQFPHLCDWTLNLHNDGTFSCLHPSNVKNRLLGKRRERQMQRKWGRRLTAQNSFSMKSEDKCLVSLSVPPGRVIVIISRGANKENEANDESVCFPSITRIIFIKIIVTILWFWILRILEQQ